MALDAFMYQDPCRVLEQKQEEALRKARACGQCVHKREMPFKGEIWFFCSFKRHTYGKRCELYVTVKK